VAHLVLWKSRGGDTFTNGHALCPALYSQGTPEARWSSGWSIIGLLILLAWTVALSPRSKSSFPATAGAMPTDSTCQPSPCPEAQRRGGFPGPEFSFLMW